jgi:AbrB family looped-hinge helix DNA binding protein
MKNPNYTRVTRKGQITIPQELRDRFGIKSGDQVELRAVGDDLVLTRRVDEKKMRSVKGILRGKNAPKTEELMQDLRGKTELL